MAAGLAALGDQHIGAGIALLDRVFQRSDQSADLDAAPMDRVDDMLGRHAHGADHELHRIAQCDLERAFAVARGHLHLGRMFAGKLGRLAGGQPRNIGAVDQAADEIAIFAGQNLVGVALILQRREGAGEDDIDTVGLAVDVPVDPFQRRLQLIRRHPGRAQHAHAAGARGLDHHVTAMREGEDRQVDAEHLGDGGAHHDD